MSPIEQIDEISEMEALDICYEDFQRSVNWFVDGIELAKAGKIADKNQYAKYIILEFARRIDKEDT